jgi:hypothetical protein
VDVVVTRREGDVLDREVPVTQKAQRASNVSLVVCFTRRSRGVEETHWAVLFGSCKAVPLVPAGMVDAMSTAKEGLVLCGKVLRAEGALFWRLALC